MAPNCSKWVDIGLNGSKLVQPGLNRSNPVQKSPKMSYFLMSKMVIVCLKWPTIPLYPFIKTNNIICSSVIYFLPLVFRTIIFPLTLFFPNFFFSKMIVSANRFQKDKQIYKKNKEKKKKMKKK